MAPFKSIIGSIRRKPTRAPDGKSDDQAAAIPVLEKTSIGHDLTHMGLKNAKTVAGAITTLASGEPMNDKDLLLENGVAMLQSLPLNSGLSQTVSNNFIGMLWDDLPHPPPTWLDRQHDTESMMEVVTPHGTLRWERLARLMPGMFLLQNLKARTYLIPNWCMTSY